MRPTEGPKQPRAFKREVKTEVKADPFTDDDDLFKDIPETDNIKMDDADDSLFSSIEMPDETASNSNTRFDS